ncbi:UbiD family decarboxylase [Streptomyces sp. 4N509B]|uniref:UbiD family decarboxylase n=1 Tax=Streptomyces sp. 4N509B TaxID=3457413 RepID=UPI003FCF9264
MTYPYDDLRQYLATLDDDGLLVTVREPVNKDTELVPLVRLQFRGLPEEQRRAFLFENVTDSRGRAFDASVAMGTFAPSRQVYSRALGAELDQVGEVWQRALASPLAPRLVANGPCRDVVLRGGEVVEAGGVDAFPHPVSTPGFDNAPYLTSPYWVTRDPEDGTYNVGTYRGMVKGPDRVGLQMDTPSQHIAVHLRKALRLGQPLQAAIVIGAVPAVGLASVQKLPYGTSEYEVAGGLMGRPLEVVRCETVDLTVPATAELVIEGTIDPRALAPEGPFGEASGYLGPRTHSPELRVTAITHRRRPVVQAFISEFPPSESTLMRKIGFENVYRRFLRQACNIGSVRDVCFYEMATCNMMFAIRLRDPSPGQAWQALYAAAGYEPSMGKIIVAVDDDVDPEDLGALVWALSFRTQPARDMRIIDHRLPRLDPSLPAQPGVEVRAEGSAILIDATRGGPYPPTSLPTEPYMREAARRWEHLGLPRLDLREPWFGYELGQWSRENRQEATLAVEGRYLETGARLVPREDEPGQAGAGA